MKVKNYNPKLPISSYYKKMDCFGRTKVCFVTNDLKVVADKVAKGWIFIKTVKGFYVQAPEIWLVDIAEPSKICYYSNSIINNYAYFLYLKGLSKIELLKIIKNLLGDGQDVFLSHGPSLEVEIRIILENKNNGGNLMFDLYSHFLQSRSYDRYLKEAKKIVSKDRAIKIQRDKDISDYSPKVSKFFSEIIKYYSLINLGKRDLYSRDFIERLQQQTDKHFSDADIFIFIPWGCFKYIGNFISDKTVDRVMLWETHLLKYETHEHKFGKLSLKNKKVVIFDKGYTGGTLNKMAKMVKEHGGRPIKVAVFPKSRLAIKNSDYIFFIDKLIKSSDINISNKNYYVDLYKNSNY